MHKMESSQDMACLLSCGSRGTGTASAAGWWARAVSESEQFFCCGLVACVDLHAVLGLPLKRSCLLRWKRSRERDLSSDLTVCALTCKAKCASLGLKLHEELEPVLCCCGECAFILLCIRFLFPSQTRILASLYQRLVNQKFEM